jgi:hypothetical protein
MTMNKLLKAVVTSLAVLTTSAVVAAPSQARTTWDTGPVVVTRDVSPTPKVVNLRVGQHAAFDRIVIDLDGKVPGYRARYVRQLRYDGSGEPVPLRGHRFLAIGVDPAKAHNAQGDSVYRGPDLQQYQLPTLRGVAFTGDFEGTVSFGIALRKHASFRVTELHSPNRLIIDVHH